jgi:outer membrane protein assembly factor BamB
MPVRRTCSVVLACAFAVAGLVGCGSGPGPVCACPAAPKPAFALDVTMAGRVRWRVPLGPPEPGPPLSPLAVGAGAVFAQGDVFSQGRVLSQGDVLYGLRLADGHRLWSRAFSRGVAGMWRWQNLVVVLTQSSGRQQQALTGLDASTGQARWTLRVGGSVNGFSPTADGGLAMSVDREDGVLELEVVDLSTGRVRWTRPVDSDLVPPLAVGGGAVLFAGGADGDANSSLTSYDDRTGHVRWTEALKPGVDTQPPLQASAGLVYLTAEVLQSADGQPTQVLLGIRAADGRVQWLAYGLAGSPDPYAPGLMSVTTSAYSGPSQDELDPATGRVRWQVVSPYQPIATLAGIVTAPGPDQISMRDTLTGQIRWTAHLNGGWLPLDVGPLAVEPAAGQVPSALQVLPAGPLLVVPAVGPDGSDQLAAFGMSDGHPAWRVTIPGPVAAPMSAVPGGILVYTV